MAGAIAQGIVGISDLYKAGRAFQAAQRNNNNSVAGLDATNRLAMCLACLADIAMRSQGSSSAARKVPKSVELFTRFLNVFIEPAAMDERNRGSGNVKDTKMVASVVSSVAGFLQCFAETAELGEKRYLEMSDDELSKQKRRQIDPDNSYSIVADANPNGVPIQCDTEGSGVCTIVPGTYNAYYEDGQVHIPGNFPVIKPNYIETPVTREEARAFAAYWNGAANGAQTAHAFADLMLAYTQFVYGDIQASLEETGRGNRTLQSLNFIPQQLHQDAVFNEYRCHFSKKPIRHIAVDPDGKTHYEKSTIELHLRNHPFSPATHLPLQAAQLRSHPIAQAAINARLQHHQQQREAATANRRE